MLTDEGENRRWGRTTQTDMKRKTDVTNENHSSETRGDKEKQKETNETIHQKPSRKQKTGQNCQGRPERNTRDTKVINETVHQKPRQTEDRQNHLGRGERENRIDVHQRKVTHPVQRNQ